MTEQEYIIATNRVKVSAALTILRDVMKGKQYATNQIILSEATNALCNLEEALFAAIEITPKPEER